jgi:hypothetical protein
MAESRPKRSRLILNYVKWGVLQRGMLPPQDIDDERGVGLVEAFACFRLLHVLHRRLQLRGHLQFRRLGLFSTYVFEHMQALIFSKVLFMSTWLFDAAMLVL